MSQDRRYVVGLIPARSGSKGVPHKNLREIQGKSLLEWSIAASVATSLITRTIVSTNSEQYAEVAKNAGAEIPFLRPEAISSDTSTDKEFVLHALDFFDKEGKIPDLVVHLRPTTPFRDPQVVNEAIQVALLVGSRATAIRSVHVMSESAYKSFELGEDGRLVTVFTGLHALDHANEARQTYPLTYSPNGYVDIIFPGYIRKSGNLHGDNVLPFITTDTIEIDGESDMEVAHAMITRKPELFAILFGDSK